MIKKLTILTLVILSACANPVQEKEAGSQEVIADTSSRNIPSIQNFNKRLAFKRFSFTINATGDSVNGKYTLTPSGYSISNEPITENIKGILSDIIINDIDGDENPEVAVIVYSGKMQEGEAILYSSNKDRSISRVNFPSIIADSVLNGYNGHDEFLFVGKNFVRRFPAGSKSRHLQYRLIKGEAGKHLVLRQVLDL